MAIKNFFSFGKNKFFWINILLMFLVLGLLVFAVLKGLDIYTQHGLSVVVPNVKGMMESEAENALKNEGLEYQIVDSSYEKKIVPGSIVDQNPNPGFKVKRGRVVYLTINSLSTPLKVLPDIADNSSLRQAQAKLLSAGFKLSEEVYITGEKDWVYGVKYNGKELHNGEKVPMGAMLTLLVGNGMRSLPVEQDSITVEPVVEESVPSASENATMDDSWF